MWLFVGSNCGIDCCLVLYLTVLSCLILVGLLLCCVASICCVLLGLTSGGLLVGFVVDV